LFSLERHAPRPLEHEPPALRPAVAGRNGMVSSGHPLATAAAYDVLRSGGNAVDAGVAAGLCLNVVHSDMTSLAGVAPITMYLAGPDRVVTLDGLGVWPAAATLQRLTGAERQRIPEGFRFAVVPAAAAAWLTALERYGTLSFGRVAGAAIGWAEGGFPMHPFMAYNLARDAEAYRRWPTTAEVFLPGGEPPRPGAVFRQPDLARTLKGMADAERKAAHLGRAEGVAAARDFFYRGPVAEAVAEFSARHGGLMTLEDLAGFRVREEPAATVRFRDVDVHGCGPWCQGPALLEALAILEHLDLAAMGHNTTAYVHAVTEVLKLAYADREAYVGDPAFVEVPLAGLLSESYGAERAAAIRTDRAFRGLPDPGNPWPHQGVPDRGPAPMPAPPGPTGVVGPGGGSDTSFVCVMDGAGNVFAATPSDSTGGGPVIPGLGFALSARGNQSRLDPGHPACLAPGKRPRLTPNPALAFRDGQPWLVWGTPGGDVQPQAMLQVLLNLVEFGMHPQAAVEAPRFATFSFPNSFYPHQYFPGRLAVESRIPAAVRDELASLGHQVVGWPAFASQAGGVCLVLRDRDTGVLYGAADPRRESYAFGW